MELLISLVAVNVLLLGFLQLAYHVATGRRLKLSLLVDHLAALAGSGMPIQSGLRVIGRDVGGYLGSRIGRVAQQMEEGKSLGEAFDAAAGTFPPLLCSMLTLGEKSGNLAAFLEAMRRSYRRISELPYQSLLLFLYPLMLSIGINLTLAGLYAGIIPKFQTMLVQQGLDPSQQDTWWPRVIVGNEFVLVLCAATLAFLVTGGTSIHYGTSLLRRARGIVDRILLHVPLLGRMLRDAAIQQFTMCAGLLLRSGAALPEALEAAASAERNSVLRRRWERVSRAVAEGSTLSSAVRAAEGESDLVWFLETGETAGLLPDHLLMTAVHYEVKVRVLSRLAARFVVPVFVVLNGLIVFASFFLVFAPVRQTLQAILERKPF